MLQFYLEEELSNPITLPLFCHLLLSVGHEFNSVSFFDEAGEFVRISLRDLTRPVVIAEVIEYPEDIWDFWVVLTQNYNKTLEPVLEYFEPNTSFFEYYSAVFVKVTSNIFNYIIYGDVYTKGVFSMSMKNIVFGDQVSAGFVNWVSAQQTPATLLFLFFVSFSYLFLSIQIGAFTTFIFNKKHVLCYYNAFRLLTAAAAARYGYYLSFKNIFAKKK